MAGAKSDPGPVDFDAVLAIAFRAGGFLCGDAVDRVRVRTADGEWRELRLPEPVAVDTGKAAPADDGVRWSPTKRRIMATLRNERTAITRTRLGQIIRRDVEGGRVLGDINHLKEKGLIHEDDGLVTDNPKKFPAKS